MARYIPHTWTCQHDDFGIPHGTYGRITNMPIPRAPLVHTATGAVQIEVGDRIDRALYTLEQIPVDQREGLSYGSIILTDNEFIQGHTRAFDGAHPTPIAYEPSIVLGHKNSDKRVRHQYLYDPTMGGDHTAALSHIAVPLIDFRRNDYKPRQGEEVQFIGGVKEDGTYLTAIYGHVLQVQSVGNGRNREEQYLIHWMNGTTSVHAHGELHTIKTVVYVHMKGAWD